MVQKTGRYSWEPLSMEYLEKARDQAKAAGDVETWALVREISRLHYVLLKAHLLAESVHQDVSEPARGKAKELSAILDREPLIIKRRQAFKKPALNSEEMLAMRVEQESR